MTEPSDYVKALARERDGYLRGPRSDKALAVDEELTHQGWCVDMNGDLVAVSTDKPAPASLGAPVSLGKSPDEIDEAADGLVLTVKDEDRHPEEDEAAAPKLETASHKAPARRARRAR